MKISVHFVYPDFYSGTLEAGVSLLWKAFLFPSPPSKEDVRVVRAICRAVSERAAVYMAVSLFTLWRLQRDSMISDPRTSDAFRNRPSPVAVAYCGAVIEKHPTVRKRCQQVLDDLVASEPGNNRKFRLVLEEAGDSGLLGAAVASVMNEVDDAKVMRSKL